MRISIDAMGGDNAPEDVISGLDYYINHFKPDDERFVLFGKEQAILACLEGKEELRQRCEIVHTDEAINMSVPPVQAVRRFKNASMRLAIEALRSNDCSFCVSGGNTGALMAVSKFVLHMIKGLDRPAICARFPTINAGKSVSMLDLGADLSTDADRLIQLAVMGATYGKIFYDVDRPRVAILNIGSESGKGHPKIHAAAHTLKQAFTNSFDFVGFIEGTSLFSGDADVVVTDGFTGNNVLKSIEGTCSMLIGSLKRSFPRGPLGQLRLLMAKGPLKSWAEKFDPRLYNGAILIGLNGVVIKSHGHSDPLAYATAVKVGKQLVAGDFISYLQNTITPIIEEMNARKKGRSVDNFISREQVSQV